MTQPKTVQPLPCPFCGNAEHDEAIVDVNESVAYVPCYVFRCTQCGVTLDGMRTFEEATENWNRRATPTPTGTEREGEPVDGKCVVPSCENFGYDPANVAVGVEMTTELCAYCQVGWSAEVHSRTFWQYAAAKLAEENGAPHIGKIMRDRWRLSPLRVAAPASEDAARLKTETYWCGCKRLAQWERCHRHVLFEHDEEPQTQAIEDAMRPTEDKGV